MRLAASCILAGAILLASTPVSARTVRIDTPDQLTAALMKRSTSARYRFGPRVRALREISAEWVTVQNQRLLRQLTWVETVSLYRSRLSGFAWLARLQKLQRLDLTATRIRSLAPLARLQRLRILVLARTPVTDLRPITHCRALRELDLARTKVTDFTPFKGRHLDKLIIGAAGLKALPDLTPFGSIGELVVTDADPAIDLGGLAKVRVMRLTLDKSPVATLRGLAGHATLRKLSLRRTRVPLAAIRAFLKRTSGVAVVTPKGRQVGRTVVWVELAPNLRRNRCALLGNPHCRREYFGPTLRPVVRWVDP